ncbi:MAG: hypothetical protein ACR2MT_07520 [Aurantibacter sp.]
MSLELGLSKTSKVLCWVGSSLLLVMAVFHGSGYIFVKEAIVESNAETFLKEIVPALFAHPSIHLLGLSAFGILAIFLTEGARKVLVLLSVLVATDALLAFYLGGVLPGILLLTSALCFTIAGLRKREQTSVGQSSL